MQQTKNKFRPPAVPLVTVDPYFNIWSFGDRLYDDFPRHWTGKRNAMTGLLKIDGRWHRFMGKVEPDIEEYFTEPPAMEQTDLTVAPMTAKYVFETAQIRLEAAFMTPLLLDDLDLMSRPFSYFSYTLSSKDGAAHEVELYLDISAEAAVDNTEQSVTFGKDETSAYCGRGEDGVLSRSGDDLRIDWGWLHLIAPGHELMILDADGKKSLLWNRAYTEVTGTQIAGGRYPSLGCRRLMTVGAAPATGFVCFGYDDVRSIEYFGEQLQAYWRRDGMTFAQAACQAVEQYGAIQKRVVNFERCLQTEAAKIGTQYADIISLAYRQTIAAHKLVWDGQQLLFISKECYSNGCAATVDVTYPSIPLYLIFNPLLVCGMLNPVFRYVASGKWNFPFAPHDVGQYPLLNGQVYGSGTDGSLRDDMQMPVEECGNMLLCVAAVCKALGDTAYAAQHSTLLQQWADYLSDVGSDPDNQLCTDDFAGHLAHNCNLSIKASLGVAAWGSLLCKMGRAEEGRRYLARASAMAAEWQAAAFDNGHYKLAFDCVDTWSIKYNLIWDTLLDLHIFDAGIAKAEVAYYLQQFNQYGLPLDSRSDYTKSDWQMWSTMLDSSNTEYTDKVVSAMWDMLCNTPDRVPFTDWYHTIEPAQTKYYATPDARKQIGFQNRTVQGGLFINLLPRLQSEFAKNA